ncbi:MAG: Ltp family lipoprotein [Clostridium sp.]|nr:Ltp family lipoprotein [Clostridium sp.]MBQ9000136.1 Ltp family lipoprotein [Clostridium sp.]
MSKLINCKDCGKEISSGAKSCPNCGAKNKKPFYKNPWLIGAALLIIASSGNTDETQTISENRNDIVEEESLQSEHSESNKIDIDTENNEKEDSIPTEYKSALKQAKTYSDMMHMSKAGIYDQLTSEYGGQFTEEAAQYAIDNVEADWKENALESAKTYQDMMAMSPQAIYDQLISSYGGQFTKEEAQYAIDNLE